MLRFRGYAKSSITNRCAIRSSVRSPQNFRLPLPLLGALLVEAGGAEVGAWEAIEAVVGSHGRAVKAGDGVGIFAGNCAPIAAAIRELLDPEDIEIVIVQRE